VAGDGGFQMTIQELGTIAQENIAVKIAIINNGYLGMVRQWQEAFYGRRYVATPLNNPDFVKIADAYGIPGLRVTDKKMVVPAIEKAMSHNGPFLIDFVVEPEENVFPMVAPGAALSDIMEGPVGNVVLGPKSASSL
jgi:acetolactate synthase-1/2/3 large subunit